MSRSNIRPRSASPAPEDISINDVPHLDVWFGQKTYFLAKQYEFEEIEPFDVFMFEHSDGQKEPLFYDEAKKKSVDFYNLGIRFWKITNNIVYYIRNIVVTDDEIAVSFIRKWINKARKDEFTATFELAPSFIGLTNPFLQDHMPRRHCISLLQQYKDVKGKPMSISHIVKFFNACKYLLIAQSCNLDKTSPIPAGKFTNARLKRMTETMLATWDLYPEFARRYAKNPTPIEDQQLSQTPDPENSFGDVIVLLTLNRCEEDYSMFVRSGPHGQRDIAFIRKTLAAGKDPFPVLIQRIPKKDRENYPSAMKTVEELRW
jgi:hypothetical protein